MTNKLPPELEEIVALHKEADPGHGAARYIYEFGFRGIRVALFESTTPLPIPAIGEIIKLHGNRVKVTGVVVGYENADPGSPPGVAVSVEVEPISEE
ncbi:hypothetical protein ACWGOK_11830 [Streptomyces eurythermus]